MTRYSLFATAFAACFAIVCNSALAQEADKNMAEPPKVGDEAPNFKLLPYNAKPMADEEDDTMVELSEVVEQGPVVLVVLRGYPGYQCGICSRQVAEFVKAGDAIAKAGAQVVMVYPGTDNQLGMKAKEFVAETELPKNFHMLIDPNYEFTNLYHLRWDAPAETAYPSTFVIDKEGKIVFAEVSKGHGGRSSVKDVLAALK